jgi:lipopolysaccharide/colanic/teichoic acid biosynthesis glycosyltransferase
MKRIFDIAVASIALAVLALPILVLTIVVRSKLGSPVFFRQVRPGLHGKPFEMVKFRTMTDARGPDGQLLSDAARFRTLLAFHQPG